MAGSLAPERDKDSYQGMPSGMPKGAKHAPALAAATVGKSQRLKPFSILTHPSASLKRCPDTNRCLARP
ncbi:MAG: hypothetical protein ACLQBK_17260 [Candidatus Sulfotelmatobacter sp.]